MRTSALDRDQVALPVAEGEPVLSLSGPLPDRVHVLDPRRARAHDYLEGLLLRGRLFTGRADISGRIGALAIDPGKCLS